MTAVLPPPAADVESPGFGAQGPGADDSDPGSAAISPKSGPRPPRPGTPSNSMVSNRLRRGSTNGKRDRVPDYNYRYYDPLTGRWPSRDPFGEDGFRLNNGITKRDQHRLEMEANLYVTVGNYLVTRIDFLGLYTLEESEASLVKKGVAKANKGWIWDSYSDTQIFDEWITLEKASAGWVSAVPACPKCLIVSKDVATNPDPKVWTDPNPGPIDKWILGMYHPGAVFEIRTIKGAAGAPSGGQCTYSATGVLLTKAPAAGSADRYGPNNDFSNHQSHDVKTYDMANALGRVADYYSVRPAL